MNTKFIGNNDIYTMIYVKIVFLKSSDLDFVYMSIFKIINKKYNYTRFRFWIFLIFIHSIEYYCKYRKIGAKFINN